MTARPTRQQRHADAGFLAAAALLLAAFGAIAHATFRGSLDAFDHTLLVGLRTAGDLADPLGPPWLEEAARDVTSLGSYVVVGFAMLAAAGWLLAVRQRGAALWLLASVVSGALLNNLLKAAFDRPRPVVVPQAARVFTSSFPSGHAMLSAVAWLCLALLAGSAARGRASAILPVALALFLTFAIGFTRIYLGLHYPSDVLAGWCAGGAWALLCRSAWPRLDAKAARPRPARAPSR